MPVPLLEELHLSLRLIVLKRSGVFCIAFLFGRIQWVGGKVFSIFRVARKLIKFFKSHIKFVSSTTQMVHVPLSSPSSREASISKCLKWPPKLKCELFMVKLSNLSHSFSIKPNYVIARKCQKKLSLVELFLNSLPIGMVECLLVQ